MVEVFKTNVDDPDKARALVGVLQGAFDCKANFDLEDCDRILRVENKSGCVDAAKITETLKRLGFFAETLPDLIPPDMPLLHPENRLWAT